MFWGIDHQHILKEVAERISREARSHALSSTCTALDAFSMESLPQQRNVILVASTTGQASMFVLSFPGLHIFTLHDNFLPLDFISLSRAS